MKNGVRSTELTIETMDDIERMAAAIVFASFEGQTFNWVAWAFEGPKQ